MLRRGALQAAIAISGIIMLSHFASLTVIDAKGVILRCFLSCQYRRCGHEKAQEILSSPACCAGVVCILILRLPDDFICLGNRVSQNLTGALEKQAIICNETKPAQTNPQISDPSSATEDTLQTRTEEPQEAAPFCMDFEVLQAYKQDIIAWIY